MSVNKKVPEIRFKGFSEAWENKKIGEILTEIKRPIELMDNESYQLVTVKRRNEGVVPRAVLKGENILVKNYFSIKAGDYLISKRQVVHGANGIIPDNLDGAVVSNEYLVITDSDDITARYWTISSIIPKMHKLFFISSYGVDIEKLVFDVADWKNRTITIPKIAEQKNITSYFQKLDNLINQHQQKHDKLSSIKKAMLKKMFPKQGETIPEIRFKGFSGEWEEKDLNNEVELFSGLTYSPSDIRKSGTLVLRSSNVKNGQLIEADNIYVNPEVVNCSNVVEGDIIVVVRNGSRSLIGKHAQVTSRMNNTVIGAFMTGIRSKQPAFINALLDTNMFTAEVEKNLGATINQITNGSFNSMVFMFPKEDEQQEIGNYFQKLDVLINQHKQQITKFNNIKQACLSKMFV